MVKIVFTTTFKKVVILPVLNSPGNPKVAKIATFWFLGEFWNIVKFATQKSISRHSICVLPINAKLTIYYNNL